jgi:hypothetical protein
MKKKFLPFAEAREFVHSLKLKNSGEWYKFCKSVGRPIYIPSNAHTVYKNDWKGMGDWLGTGNIAVFRKKFRGFNEARKFVHELNLKGEGEWRLYAKSDHKPVDIPSNPNYSYRTSGWKNWGDWLGTGRTREFRSFDEAREFVRTLELKGGKYWKEYCKSGVKPIDIPFAPNKVYEKEFIIK